MPEQQAYLLYSIGDPEAELVARAKARSAETWADLYGRYYRKLYRYIYYQVREQAVAEDLAAQVFTEALARIHSFQYRGIALSTWLYRIAHHLAVSHLRSRKRATDYQARAARAGPAAEADPAEQVANSEELWAALERLTPEQRQAIVLRFLEGMSGREVARVMGKGDGAVRVLQHRALQSLRRLLLEQHVSA